MEHKGSAPQARCNLNTVRVSTETKGHTVMHDGVRIVQMFPTEIIDKNLDIYMLYY